MQSGRARRQEAEYRLSLSAGVLVSIAAHLLLLAAGSFLLVPLHVRAEQPPLLGYRGPQRALLELEVLEPNSVQSYFYQRRREGRRSTPEYHVMELDLTAGPNPILVRRNQERPQPQPRAVGDDIQVRPPVPAVHAQLSFSQDFVILEMVKPEYPEYERSRAIEGFVLVACYVTAEGSILDEQVMESGTVPPGAPTAAFERASLVAVRQWKVLPPRRDGAPRGAWLPIRITFDMSGLEP